jgi:DNA-binding NarL/FixJ family response regulator
MAIVVAIVAAGDIVSGGLRSILASDDDVRVLDHYPCVGTRPDVVLYDALGLERGAAELCGLVQAGGSVVLVVGRDLRPDLAHRAVAHGACGCVSLEADGRVLLRAIHGAVAHRDHGNRQEWAITPGVQRAGAGADLTPREVSVLSGVAQGLSNAEICALLHIGANTVKSVIRSAYRKIGVDSRSQAVAWCLRNGFEPPSGARAGVTTASAPTTSTLAT